MQNKEAKEKPSNTATNNNNKEEEKKIAKSVSQSNKEQIQKDMPNDDKITGLPDKILSSVAKEK